MNVEFPLASSPHRVAISPRRTSIAPAGQATGSSTSGLGLALLAFGLLGALVYINGKATEEHLARSRR